MKARLKFSLLILGLLASGVVRAQSELSYDTNSTFLKWPEHIYMGEPAGVAHNSKVPSAPGAPTPRRAAAAEGRRPGPT